MRQLRFQMCSHVKQSTRCRLTAFPMLALVALVLISCATAPSQYPPAFAPESKTLPASFDSAFEAGRKVLNNDGRLLLDTVDKAGRLIAYERTSGLIFLRHRTILDVKFEATGPQETKISMRAKAQDYEIGGLTREAGWYPSSNVDEFLANDIMTLIEQEAIKTSKP
ncbi:hypothetical protein HZA56_10465 [Candidatus Poribacteria bacterium]|nr:hypothetical protein [Candidatus Poribacteria bacterium]